MRLVPAGRSTHADRTARIVSFRLDSFAPNWGASVMGTSVVAVATAAIGALFFTAALLRFRQTVSEMQG